MDAIMKRIVMGVLGLGLVLGWWTCTGRHSSASPPPAARIPDKIWEGGGGKCTFEVELSDPGEVEMAFYRWDEDYKGDRDKTSFHAKQQVPAGKHRFVVEVPKRTNVSPEVWMPKANAKVGSSRIAFTLTCGEKQIYTHEATLDRELPDNEPFGFELNTVPDAGTGEGW